MVAAANDRAFQRVRAGYERSLNWVLQHATLMLIILCGTIALNVTLYIKIPKGFLPSQDTGQLMGFARGDDSFSYQLMQPKIEIYRKMIMADPRYRTSSALRVDHPARATRR
jgi:multidrug efflux pump